MSTQARDQQEFDLVVLYENEDWQRPLFDVLDKRGIKYGRLDLKSGAFDADQVPKAKLYFNQASPSAYVRGRDRVVPFTLSLLRNLEIGGAKVLNGANVFAYELSKSAQAATMKALGIDHPKTIVFNDIDALAKRDDLLFPAMLKPEQGGSGARMHKVESLAELKALLHDTPSLWEPDKLLLLQEFCPHDPSFGIVRLEFVAGELLYAMRVVTHGRYNLCPSEACNPVKQGLLALPGQQSRCAAPVQAGPPVEFYAYSDVPAEAVQQARRIVHNAKMDVAGIEYLETPDGRRVFYDINANSNLRAPVAREFGNFDPFERVADYLEQEILALTRKSTGPTSPPAAAVATTAAAGSEPPLPPNTTATNRLVGQTVSVH